MACADCVSGFLQEGTPTGAEIKIANIPVYAVGAEDAPRIVVFGTDIFGWRFNNTRLLADEYAAHGFRVLVPDLFDGRELPTWTLSARDPVNTKPTLFERTLAKPLSLFVLVPFVIHNAPRQVSVLTAIAAALRKDHPAAKLGFVGFCWGGRYALSTNALWDATVAAHPSRVKYPDELEGITKPISFALAKDDHNYDAARGKETEKKLTEKGVPVEVVVYEDVQHGWTVRGNLKDEKKKLARDNAKEQAIKWFERYLVATEPATEPTPAPEPAPEAAPTA